MNKRISIKNVKFSEALSEETNAYVADVYLDNKKFGYARNQGHGGETDIQPYPDKRELFQEANEYAQSLPDIDTGTFTFKSTLDWVVDDLLVKYLEAKETKKMMSKGIVFKKKQGHLKLIQWNMPLAKVLKHPQGEGIVRTKVLKLKSEGYEILNTNLPKDIQKEL